MQVEWVACVVEKPLVLCYLGAAAGCGGNVFIVGAQLPDNIATCEVTRLECDSGFSFSNGTVGCTNLGPPASQLPGDSLLPLGKPDRPRRVQAILRRITDTNNPSAPQRYGGLYDMDSEGCSATVVSSRPTGPGECRTIEDTASDGASAFATCTLGDALRRGDDVARKDHLQRPCVPCRRVTKRVLRFDEDQRKPVLRRGLHVAGACNRQPTVSGTTP